MSTVSSNPVIDTHQKPIESTAPSATTLVDLAVIIVNYNVEALLRNCLRTVYASETDMQFDVCVVDNNSSDDSVEMVRREFPQAKLVANEGNPGFSAANNQGYAELVNAYAIEARYILLLNPDTEVGLTTLQDAVAYMDSNPDVGVLGPKLLLPTGELDIACRRSFPTPRVAFYRMSGLARLFPNSPRFASYNLTYLDINEFAEVDSVVGAFMLVSRAAVDKVGMLDERFWMYGEDLDWSKRIKDAGWKVVYNPTIEALHIKRASSKQNRKADFEFYRAMLIFYHKHYRPTTSPWLHYLTLLGIAVKGGRAIWPDIAAGRNILIAAADSTA